VNAARSRSAALGRIAGWIDPSRTAVLIIDMQADFASPKGAMARSGANLVAVPAALAAASKLARVAREAGARLIFIGLESREQTDSAAWAERLRRKGGAPARELALCRAGTPGADFHGPEPEAGDEVIAKTRYSGFFATRLDATLKAADIDTLIVGGLTTDCCVDCTVRDAFHLDYHVFIAVDACAAYDRADHDAAMKTLMRNFAILTDTGEVAAAWAYMRSEG
jgi:nicotinamidase-related amidase